MTATFQCGQPVRFTQDIDDDGLSAYPPPIARAGMTGTYEHPIDAHDGPTGLHLCTLRYDGVLFAVAASAEQIEAARE